MLSQAFRINPNPKQGIGSPVIRTVSAGTSLAAGTRASVFHSRPSHSLPPHPPCAPGPRDEQRPL